MKERILTVNQPTHIIADDIANLLCCAFEGGSHYWVEEVILDFKYDDSDKDSYGDWADFPVYWITHPDWKLNITVFYEDGSENETFTITLENLKKAVKKMAKSKNLSHHFENFKNDDYDSITGDVFLQFAVFGECIYG